MADYHVLRATDDGFSVEVVVHVPTPDEANIVGRALAACVAEDPDQPSVTSLPSISPAEESALADGSLVEHRFRFSINPNRATSAKQAELERQVAHIRDVAGPRVLRQRYWAWGHEGDV